MAFCLKYKQKVWYNQNAGATTAFYFFMLQAKPVQLVGLNGLIDLIDWKKKESYIMGIIRAAMSAAGGGLADQWLEVIEADNMSSTTVLAPGTKVRPKDRRNQNKRGTDEVISNGSIIQVYENQFMLLVDGGKIIDYTAEPGYYKVENGSSPSMFNGQFGEALKETFDRIRFGGANPHTQKVYFLNMQEIKDIAFGTPSPINYFDNFYNAELFLRAFGYFSIKIVDPLKFYAEAIPRNLSHVDIAQIQKLYISEFLTAFQTSIGKMSVDGIRISHVTSKSQELADYMMTVLDDSWMAKRGMQIESVGISSISYDDESKELIKMRNQGAMLSDATVREGYVQGAVARGLEAAGSNASGSMAGFMGMNTGMNAGGGFMGAASQSNQQQMQQQAAQRAAQPAAPSAPADGWKCSCGAVSTGKFCTQCGNPKPQDSSWKCACGTVNTGRFCSECGKPKPSGSLCPKCGWKSEQAAKFCPECGEKLV